MADDNLKLICFSGAGRSGSTLLARLLGEIPGFHTVGEGTAYSLEARIRANASPCSCGRSVEDCEFWREVLEDVPDVFARSGGDLIRTRGLPLLLLPWRPPGVNRGLDDLGKLATEFLFAVRKRTGADVIVDSSKNPAFIHVLSRVPDIDLYVIQLVRDARGFVSSRSKPKGNLKRIKPFNAAKLWLIRNLAAGWSRRRAKKSWLIRYEDFVRNPASHLDRIVRDVTGHPAALDFIDGSQAEVHRQHMLAGNPDKFLVSRLTIEERSWQLDRRLNFLVTAVTLPLLLRYGYLRRAVR